MPGTGRWIIALGEYIVKGPSMIRRSTSRSQFSPVASFSLSQRTVNTDPEERLTVFVPDVPSDERVPRTLTPIIRRVIWNRYSDIGRRRTEELDWPDLAVHFYRTRWEELSQIDMALRELDHELSSLSFVSEGPRLSSRQ